MFGKIRAVQFHAYTLAYSVGKSSIKFSQGWASNFTGLTIPPRVRDIERGMGLEKIMVLGQSVSLFLSQGRKHPI